MRPATPFVLAFGLATSPNVASLLGEEMVAAFLPPAGEVPAEPGRGEITPRDPIA